MLAMLFLLLAAFLVDSQLLVIAQQTCKSGEIRLGGQAESSSGLVELCDDDGEWNGLCGWSFSCNEAKVVCRQAGFADALSHSVRFANPRKDTEFGVYKCTGSESSITDCPPDTFWSGFSSCDHWRISVECSNLNETENCTTENSLRLVDGSSDSEGQLQICRNSRWTDVCSSTSYLYNLGSIACRQLGYTSPFISVMNNGHYYSTTKPRVYSRVNCYDSAYSGVSSCSISSECIQCRSSEVSVKCEHKITDCVNGSIRLVGGPNGLEGNLEMCYNGIWGGILSNVEGNTKELACASMGFSDKGSTIIRYNSYKRNHSPVLVQHINCCHEDKTILDCDIQYVDYLSGSFDRSNNLLGLRCTDGCTNGEMRLTGGKVSSEGVVELCVSGVWTLVGLDSWDENDASVVCLNINSDTKYASATAMNSTKFKKSSWRSVRYTSFRCLGYEKSLINCGKSSNYQTQNEIVAAVQCGCACSSGTDSSTGDRNRREVVGDGNQMSSAAAGSKDGVLTSAVGMFVVGSVFGTLMSIGGLFFTRFFIKKWHHQ